MALVNKLVKQVDLPVWEWMRFAPVATAALNVLCYGDANDQRYMYYIAGTVLYRYDTYSDSWQALATTPITLATVAVAKYSTYGGYRGNILDSDSTTAKIAGLAGNTLVGYKIRITAGKGIGQERTINSITQPYIWDGGILTSIVSTALTDTTKKWKINQWVGYQLRIVFGTGATMIRKILYNDATNLYISDPNYEQLEPWNNMPFTAVGVAIPVTTAGSQGQYYIESSIITVDTWDVEPDTTSSYVVMSGGIWILGGYATYQGFLLYYDILTDTFYYKTGLTSHSAAALGTEIALERTGEVGGSYATGAITAATKNTVTTSSNLEAGRYANYQIRIKSGLGIGQQRRIVNNTGGAASKITISYDWETTPDATSTFDIFADTQKLTLIGNAASTMYQYLIEHDLWTTGPSYDRGVVRNGAIKFGGQEAIGVATATNNTAGITVLNATPTASGGNYAVGDIVTISTGGTLGSARVESVNAVGGVTSVSLYTCGINYTTGTGKATTGGSGSGLTLNITTVGNVGRITTSMNHNLIIGDAFTFSGANVASAAWNGSYTVLGTPSLTIVECIVTAVVSFTALWSNGTNLLVDSSKNWTPNEHIGKIVHITLAGIAGTTVSRRIIANDATTLSWTLSATAPVTGTGRYIIQAPQCFGRDVQWKELNKQAAGFASSGTSTTLVDSSKSWYPNQYCGYYVRIISGTGYNNTFGDILITTNDATTLTLLTPGFTPDTTTEYQIMDSFGRCIIGGVLTVTAAAVAGGSGYAIGDLLLLGTGTGAIVRVLTLSATAVATVGLVTGGTGGYSVATVATTKITGSGNDACTVAIASITTTATNTTTILQDTTKNWTVNQWAGKRVRFITGTGFSQESTITSNTSNSFTLSAGGTLPDASTSYCILGIAPRGAGASLQWIYGGSDTANAGKYMFSARGAATNQWDKYDITTETWDYTYFQQPYSEYLTTGSMYSYDGEDTIYFQVNSLGRIMAYNVYTNTVDACSTIPYGMSTAITGNRMEIVKTADGLKYLYCMRNTGSEFWRALIYWE